MTNSTPLFVLDQADDGEWLVWDKSDDAKHRMGHDKTRVATLIQCLNAAHRPNVERTADGIAVCWNDHDKGQSCEYEYIPRVPPNAVLGAIERLALVLQAHTTSGLRKGALGVRVVPNDQNIKVRMDYSLEAGWKVRPKRGR